MGKRILLPGIIPGLCVCIYQCVSVQFSRRKQAGLLVPFETGGKKVTEVEVLQVATARMPSADVSFPFCMVSAYGMTAAPRQVMAATNREPDCPKQQMSKIGGQQQMKGSSSIGPDKPSTCIPHGKKGNGSSGH